MNPDALQPDPSLDAALRPFRYRAQTTDARMVDGTIDAADAEDARRRLTEMGLIITSIDAQPTARPKALRGDDFAAFNEQLAQLTAAGMPVERGLRLIAEDMRSGRLAESVRRVANDLEKGRPLHEAFGAHRSAFPRIYGRLVEAGVRSGNLPGMLMNIGRHLELIARLRQTLWRSLAYPLLVFIVLLAVVIFIGIVVVPGFESIYRDFDTELPRLTQWMLSLTRWVPWLLGALLFALLAFPIIAMLMRGSGRDDWFVRAAMKFPLIGPVLRSNLIARWLDGLYIAISAGLDLPAAIEVAGDAVNSPPIQRDGQRLTEAISSGWALGGSKREIIPATVVAAIELAPRHGDLPSVLASMSRMYQQQAELKLGVMDVLLAPILMIGLTFVIGFVVVALFLPMVTIMQSVSA